MQNAKAKAGHNFFYSLLRWPHGRNDPIRSRFRGCLVGGAVGDALGAPIEFMNHTEIIQSFGPEGIRDFVDRIGSITDDTQMTLFTAEGMLRAHVQGLAGFSGVTDHAYMRWLGTQGQRSVVPFSPDGYLWEQKELHSWRSPGHTCLRALKSKKTFGDPANNDSKGCGGVMRVAPVGLYTSHNKSIQGIEEHCFTIAAEIAGLTHGHPSGQWPAGVLALLVMRCLGDTPLIDALAEAKEILKKRDQHDETLAAILKAESLAASGLTPDAYQLEKLGGGWVAEEALAIGIYCALVARDFEHGITLAVNHGGDSDSTGSIAGNLLGAMLGMDAIPKRWTRHLELLDVIQRVADDLYEYPGWNIGKNVHDRNIRARYPGW